MKTNKLKSIKNNYQKELQDAIDVIKEKYQKQYFEAVKESLSDKLYICSGMGSTTFYTLDDRQEVENKFTELVNDIEWGDFDLNTNLYLPYKMSQSNILTQEAEDKINSLYREITNFSLTSEILKKHAIVSKHIAHIRYLQGQEINEQIIKQ